MAMRWASRAVGLVCLPFVLWLALGGVTVSPMNGIDEYIYIGAVERLRDFLLRWPDTYYAARFGYILPEWVSEHLFGADLGYFVVRFALLGLIAVAGRLRGAIDGWSAALGALLLVSPIVVSAAFNTYTISMAFLFLLCGVSWLSGAPLDGRGRATTLLMAGAALSMSWNAHFTALPVCFVIVLIYAADVAVESRHDRRAVLRNWVPVGIGLIGVVVAGLALYRWKFGVTDLYGPTLRQARQDTNSVFIDKGFAWMKWRPYLLFGPLSVCAGTAVWRTTTDATARRAIRRLVLFTSGAWAVFAYFQWITHDPLLSIFYYTSMPLGLSLLTFARSLSIVSTRLCPRYRAVAIVGAAAATIFVWRSLDTVKPGYFVVLAVCAVAAVAAVAVVRSERWRFAAVALLVLVGAWTTVAIPHTFPAASEQFRVDPQYDRLLFSYTYDGTDIVDVARSFARLLPTLPESRGEIRVWFDSSGPMNQILSTMVHYRSALQAPGGLAMPEYDAFVPERLATDRPRFVVVLDAQSGDVDAGIDTIQSLAPYRLVSRNELRSGSVVASVALLERSDGQWRDFPCAGPGHQALLCP